MTSPGIPELLIILFIVLLFVGAKKLPGLANSVGTSIKEFRRSAGEALDGDDESADTDVPSEAEATTTDNDPER